MWPEIVEGGEDAEGWMYTVLVKQREANEASERPSSERPRNPCDGDTAEEPS